MLIETKEIQKKALGKEPLYEIVIGLDEDNIKQNNMTNLYSKPLQNQKPIKQESEDVLPRVKEPKELKEIKSQINKLGDKVNLIQNMFWDEKSPEIETQIPPEFAEIYRLASQSGMDAGHLNEIMRMTLTHMPLQMRENSTTGKTTSIAKLAARYSYLMEKKYKVGLVVLDTYRIGAVEQLMQYARMMKLGIETVVDPPEFATALESLKYCDYILIDTMGSSPYDKGKIEKIYECLNANDTEYNIDVVLTMPSSIKYEDMQATYENFSNLGVDTLMFTKLDETKGYGNIFSLSYETKKPISYFSVGQEVPEDLVCATSEFLVECLLNGFNRSKA